MRVSPTRVRRKRIADGCGVAVPVSAKAPFVSFYHIRDVIRMASTTRKSPKWRCNDTSRGTRVGTATPNTGQICQEEQTRSFCEPLWQIRFSRMYFLQRYTAIISPRRMKVTEFFLPRKRRDKQTQRNLNVMCIASLAAITDFNWHWSSVAPSLF